MPLAAVRAVVECEAKGVVGARKAEPVTRSERRSRSFMVVVVCSSRRTSKNAMIFERRWMVVREKWNKQERCSNQSRNKEDIIRSSSHLLALLVVRIESERIPLSLQRLLFAITLGPSRKTAGEAPAGLVDTTKYKTRNSSVPFVRRTTMTWASQIDCDWIQWSRELRWFTNPGYFLYQLPLY